MPPLLILLDLLMPEMDGFAFLERLRSQPEWRKIPVIVVTAKQLTAEEGSGSARRHNRVTKEAERAY